MRDKTFGLIKKILSLKVFIMFVIIGLTYWNITSYYRLKILLDEKKLIEDQYLITNYLTKAASNMEGYYIDNIGLKNISGYKTFDSLFKEKEYIIAIYQNGLVCSPCLEYVTKSWANYRNQFESSLSPDMIIINNCVDGEVLRYLNSVNLQSTYYIDSTNYIHDNIVKVDQPTNFLFLINKKRQIIFATYFSVEVKENFVELLQKANRYLVNRS